MSIILCTKTDNLSQSPPFILSDSGRWLDALTLSKRRGFAL
jgi:hypothetical protein